MAYVEALDTGIGKGRQKPPMAAGWASWWAGRALVAGYVRAKLQLSVVRLEALPVGPKVFAANHPTTTDPFYLLGMVRERVSMLVTNEVFRVPVFGTYLRLAGHVPVVRGGGGWTVQEGVRLLRAGRSVAIFPEGALSPLQGGIGFHRAHSGVARLAMRTGSPVIPVGIALDPGRVQRIEVAPDGEPVEARLYLRGPYAVTVGRPMHLEGDVSDWERVRLASSHVMQRIAQLSRESARRLRAAQGLRLEVAGVVGATAAREGWARRLVMARD